MAPPTLPVLIVGRGVAGTTLAFRLWQNNIPFRIIDKGSQTSSSAVASGLINPVVVKHFRLSWMAQEFTNEAFIFYHFIECLTHSTFYYPLEIFRVFHNQDEFSLSDRKSKEPGHELFMKEPAMEASPNINAPYGGGTISLAVRIDVETFLESSARFFSEKGLLINEDFNYQGLSPATDGWNYGDQTFSGVFFCEGTRVKDNPWFNYLPVKPAKGQLVTIVNGQLSEDMAVSKKIFILPTGNQRFKVGAAWDHTFEPGITTEAADHLREKFGELVTDNTSFTIEKQSYGFRPTVPDRRPLLGQHPHHKGLYIFNGLGSKGYMMAPWLSRQLYAFAFEGKELDGEVDCQRYKNL